MSDEMNNGQDHGNQAPDMGQNREEHNNNQMNQYSFWAEQVARNNQETESRNRMDETTNYQENVNFTMGDSPKMEEQFQSNSYQENVNQTQFYSEPQQNYYGFSYGPNAEQAEAMAQELRRRKQERKQRIHRVMKQWAVALTAGVLAAGAFIGVITAYQYFDDKQRAFRLTVGGDVANPIPTTDVLDKDVERVTDVSSICKDVKPAIVAIDSVVNETYEIFGQQYSQETPGSGSGIIVGQTETELLIATNNHVVAGASTIDITFIDGSSAEGITKGTDASADLAVVAVDLKELPQEVLEKIKVASLGNSDQVLEGEMAIAIGNALGYGQSTTVGYISAVNREVQFKTGKMTLLQTDAAINPGNSGGALINIKGEVIGINSAKLAEKSIEGIGYAIPISYAQPILTELMSRETVKEEDQGYLGVSIFDVTEDISKAYSMPIGVCIQGFGENSAAEKAGLQIRDVITAINGVEVATSSALKEKIISYKYDTVVKVTVQRIVDGEYKEIIVDVKLGKRPKDIK